jgi:hypothetical protein
MRAFAQAISPFVHCPVSLPLALHGLLVEGDGSFEDLHHGNVFGAGQLLQVFKHRNPSAPRRACHHRDQPVPQGDIPTTVWEAIHQHYVFCVPEGELLVSYPLPTRDSDMLKGPLSYNVAWYRPTDEAMLADLCTDGEGRLHEMSIPLPLIRPDVVADMKASTRALLAPPIANVIERAEQPFFQAIYDLISPRVVVGGVGLLEGCGICCPAARRGRRDQGGAGCSGYGRGNQGYGGVI